VHLRAMYDAIILIPQNQSLVQKVVLYILDGQFITHIRPAHDIGYIH
jgi:hypothetical protein